MVSTSRIKKLYTWIFEKKSTTGEETSVSQEFKAIKEYFGSQTSGSGSSNRYYSGKSSSRTTYNNILEIKKVNSFIKVFRDHE